MATAMKSYAGRFLIPTASLPSPGTDSSTCAPCYSSITSASAILRYSSPSRCAAAVASGTNFFQWSEASIRNSCSSQGLGLDWKFGGLVGRTGGYSLRRRGWLAAATSFRTASLGGAGLCSCKLKDDGFQGRSSRSASCLADKRKDSCDGKEAPVVSGGLNPEFKFAGAGEEGILVGGLEHHARLVVEIRRVLSKDREWLEEFLLGLGDVEGRRRVGGGQAWSDWNRGLLLAVPGVVAGLNLSGPQSVLEALGVLAAIITVHEAGHFLAARLQNIHVTKFAVGFGPTLAKYQQKGVEYSLRAFPFGGFVAFPDDDPNSEFSPDDPDLLKNRPMLDRALVISAGVIANIIFAYSVLFVQTIGVGLVERELLPGVVIPEVISKSAAAKGGMQVGDVVLAVDGYKLSSDDSAVFELVDTIKRSAGRSITFFVQRGAEIVGVEVTPDENRDGSGRIGVQLSPNAKPHRVKADNLIDAAVKSSREFSRLTATVFEGLKALFFNFEKTVDSVSGPVAIVAVGAEVARSDVAGLYQFAAIVNINLALVNLLPLPALDGGYLALVLLEALRGGKKLPDGVEQGIMSSGVLLLLTLGIVLMVRDTLNLGFVQQML